MSRIRLGGLIVLTVFTLLMLGVTVGSVVGTTQSRQGISWADLLLIFVPVIALIAATGGLWSQWIVRNVRNDSSETVPSRYTPRSKYAVWAGSLDLRRGRPTNPKAVAVRKIRRRQV